MPIVSTAPPAPQDLRAFQEWLSPDHLDIAAVWSVLGGQDIHPPLYITLIHVLRVSGLEFQTAFLSVNLLGIVLIAGGVGICCRREQIPPTRTCLALLFVALTPAAFAAGQEARHWVLFSGLSMVSIALLSSASMRNLRGEPVQIRAYALVVFFTTAALLTEYSFVLGLLAWFFVSYLLSLLSGRTRQHLYLVLRIAIPVSILWALVSPGVLRQFRYATSMDSDGDWSLSLFVPHLNTDISAHFLRRMGDLWQMGGDRRVTYVLLVGSSALLLLTQLWVIAGARRPPIGARPGRKITLGFVVGLTGTLWTLIHFLLFSFEYLPSYAVGFKYVLPFGTLLLLGVYDAVLRLRLPTLGALLVAGVIAYHAEALDLAGIGQGAIVTEMMDSDGIAVVGERSDAANLLYAINHVDRSSTSSVLLFSNPALWRETVCDVFAEDSEIAVFVERPPWGVGLSDLLGHDGIGDGVNVLGQLEFGEVALVNVCPSRERA